MCNACNVCHMNTDFDSIGSSLLQHSASAPFSATGALDRLFPFIYQASQRMSSRAIAAWLAKEHNVQLGYTSIARALRESRRRLLEFGEEMVAVAEILEPPRGEPERIPRVLCDEQKFRIIENHVGKLNPVPTYSGSYRLPKEQDAANVLASRWFILEEFVRDDVLEFLAEQAREEEAGAGEINTWEKAVAASEEDPS